jgi:hypothetical protein
VPSPEAHMSFTGSSHGGSYRGDMPIRSGATVATTTMAMARGALVVLSAGLAIGACSVSPEPSVATARTPTGQPTSAQTQTAPTPSSPGAAHDLTSWVHAQRAWVACLRSNGMTVDDPDANGDVNVQLGPGESKAGGRVGAALSACQTLQVPRPAAVGPTFTAQQIEMFRSYARCMQQNGAPDFPDPQADGSPPKRQPGIQLWDVDTPGARQASAACGHIVGDLGIAGAGLG